MAQGFNVKNKLRKYPLYRYFRYLKGQLFHRLFIFATARGCQAKAQAVLKTVELSPVQVKETRPQASLIEITNACNLNCVMCNTKMSKRPIGLIEPRVFEKILHELKSVGIESVGLHTVGETFMYKNLSELIKIAARNQFHVWISTNGQFPEKIEELYRHFPKVANVYRFSIDGATRATYEGIRRGASFDKLIQSLEGISKINQGKKDYAIDLSINSILSMTNIYEIPLFFKAYEKYCWPEKITFSAVDGLSPDTAYFKKEFNFPGLVSSKIPCRMPFKNIFFTYGGKATLCCRDYEEELVVGDISEVSILDLWNSSAAEVIRDKHQHPLKMNIRACRMCFGPYDFVSSIMNEYIHFLYYRFPRMTPQKFGDRLVALLAEMNLVLLKKDKEGLGSCVEKAFRI